ncbi:MAG: DUF938 domain-containing protein [bacterium]
MKQFSESCVQNQEPILEVLQQTFDAPGLLLEIGSGTGQHAAWLPGFLPHIRWQPSDRAENLPSIRAWLDESSLENVLQPLELDVTQVPWPVTGVDYVFSANTVHIMAWPMVQAMFQQLGTVMEVGGEFCLYGPFNYEGHFTSDSNERFDGWLKSRDPRSGVRDFEALNALAQDAGLELLNDFEMPANNRILHWRKTA